MNGRTPDTCCKRQWLNGWQQPGVRRRVIVGIARLVAVACYLGIAPQTVTAEPVPSPKIANLQPDPAPLNLEHFQPGNTPPDAVSATDISTTRLTVPSLWWMRDQYAAEVQSGDRLISDWIAYPGVGDRSGRVDLLVNRQFWSLLDYLQRYSFIHEFGTAASDYGYSVRIFDKRGNFLAAYTCDFTNYISRKQILETTLSQSSTPTSDINAPLFSPYVRPSVPLNCSISLDYGDKSGLGGRPTQGVEAFPRGFGTGQP